MHQIPITLLGHRDHGKSTLIGRLLVETNSVPKERIAYAQELSTAQGKEFEYAFLMDSFREERENEMTMDTTSAKLKYHDTIFEMIDVPGHKELAKNMVSGASRAQSGLLVVSAKSDEGLQEETRLHLFLGKMLGLKKLVVAITKMDLVGFDNKVFENLKNTVTKYLSFVGFDAASVHFIPVSAMQGANVVLKSDKTPWYNGPALLPYMLEAYASKVIESKPLRFLVQDTYNIDNRTLHVGQVKQGILKKGKMITFMPQNQTATIRALASGKPFTTEGKNEGLELDSSIVIERGSVGYPNHHVPALSRQIFAKLFFFPQTKPSLSSTIQIQSATGTCDAQLSLSFELDIQNCKQKPATNPKSLSFFKANLSFHAPVLFETEIQTPFLGRFVVLDGGRITAVGIVEDVK